MRPNEPAIRHDTATRRFLITLPAGEGLLSYTYADAKTLDLEHTFVPPSARGTGIAARLAQAALDFAREHEYRVIPSCSYIHTFLTEHPEYRDLEAR